MSTQEPKKPSRYKLKFTKEEKLKRKAGKTEVQAEKYEIKRDKYRRKQPTNKKRLKERHFDENKGKAKTRLRFNVGAIRGWREIDGESA